jgi:hypothetical protein
VNGLLNVAFVVAVKALDADAVVECTDKAAVDKNLVAVVHIDTVGIVSPVTDDLDVSAGEIIASHRTDVVDARVADGDTVDNYVVAVFDLYCVMTDAVFNSLKITGGFMRSLEENLCFVAASVEDTVTEDANVVGIDSGDAGINNCSCVKIKGLALVELDKSNVVLTGTVVDGLGIVEIYAVVNNGVCKNVQSIVTAVRLNGAVLGVGKSKNNSAVLGDLGLDAESHGADYNLFKRITGLDLECNRFVGCKGKEIDQLCLIQRTLMAGPTAVEGMCRNSRDVKVNFLTVDLDGITVVLHVAFLHGIDLYCHNENLLSENNLKQDHYTIFYPLLQVFLGKL